MRILIALMLFSSVVQAEIRPAFDDGGWENWSEADAKPTTPMFSRVWEAKHHPDGASGYELSVFVDDDCASSWDARISRHFGESESSHVINVFTTLVYSHCTLVWTGGGYIREPDIVIKIQ